MVKLVVNDKDVTKDFIGVYTSVRIIDKDGVEADELEISVTGNFRRPAYEDNIKIWINNVFYGAFLVQSTSLDYLQKLSITATGTNFSRDQKVRKTRSFSNISLGSIASKIAKEHGLNNKVGFTSTIISHLIQENESDLHFLTRVAKDYDAIFTIKNNTLIFIDRTESLPEFSVNLGDCDAWEINYQDKKTYGSCVASYRDTKENSTLTSTVGRGTPILKFQEVCKNKEEATNKAQAKLKRANRGTKKGYFSKKGEYFSAGSKLQIKGSAQDNGAYTIEKVTSLLDADVGFTVDVDFTN